MSRIQSFSLSILVGGAAWLATAHAHADVRFELGGRTGYGLPFGGVTRYPGDGLGDVMSGQVPLWFDVGVRIGGHVFVGGYYSFGFGIVGTGLRALCDSSEFEVSCSAYAQQLGAEALYHFAKSDGALDPWLGAGTGYEWMSFSQPSVLPLPAYQVESSGFEFLNLQLGLDIPVVKHMAIGPFAAFTLGQYSTAQSLCRENCGSVTKPGSLHEWLFLGLRETMLF